MGQPNPDDRTAIQKAAADIAILARCLDVEDHLARWATERDPIAGGIAADGLDQALGLLDQLARGRAQGLADAVDRLTRDLPPPLE